jgi:hypothetical protein
MPRTTAADDILDHGHATIALPAQAADILAALRAEAARFFTLAEAVKRQHGSGDFNFGYRPYSCQYSVAPDRPDLNESFTYWADNPATIPNAKAIAPFLRALSVYWAIAAEVTRVPQFVDIRGAETGR